MALVAKNLSAIAGDIRDVGSIPGLERPSGGGHGDPPQCSCLENPIDRGAWWATVHRLKQSWTWLRWLSTWHLVYIWVSLVVPVKNPPASAEDTRHEFDPWIRKIPWYRKWQSIPVFLVGKFHGQRSLAMRMQRVGHDWARARTVCICQSYCFSSSPLLLFCVHKSVFYCLCLYSCPANRFISTIFLDFTSMC